MTTTKHTPEDEQFLTEVHAYLKERHCTTLKVTIEKHPLVVDLQKGRVQVAYGEKYYRFPSGERDIEQVKAYIEGAMFGLGHGRAQGVRETQLGLLTTLGIEVDDDGVVRYNP